MLPVIQIGIVIILVVLIRREYSDNVSMESVSVNIPEIFFIPGVCNPRYSHAHFITTIIYVSISMLSKIVMNCNLLRILLNMWLSKRLNAMMIQSFKNWKIEIVLQLVHDCLHFNVLTGDVTEICPVREIAWIFQSIFRWCFKTEIEMISDVLKIFWCFMILPCNWRF